MRPSLPLNLCHGRVCDTERVPHIEAYCEQLDASGAQRVGVQDGAM
jgi:hypothetical protein